MQTNKPSITMNYGTSGYRHKFSLDLKNCIKRATLGAIIRKNKTNKNIGIMITASHNPVNDNGIKIIDFNGEFIPLNYEKICDELVNSKNLQETYKKYEESTSNSKIILGCDTRPSSQELLLSVLDVLNQIKVSYINHSVVSTPELQFLTKQCNISNNVITHSDYLGYLKSNLSLLKKEWIVFKKTMQCEFCDEEEFVAYNKPFLSNKKNLEPKIDENISLEVTKPINSTINSTELDSFINLASFKSFHPVDTAYGVGTRIIKDLDFNIQIITGSILNYQCGSDYILTSKNPINYILNQWIASFDGDCDRLIYFRKSNKLEILDGDDLAILLTLFIKKLTPQLNVGCVLSIYSNSKAIEYVKKYVPVIIAQTGVKNFIKEAKKFSIGIYFEPNGHGAVYYDESIGFNSQLQALLNLLSMGDSVANYLVFESFIDLNTKLYVKNPILDKAMAVKEKKVVNIKEILDKFNCLGFIRPSGTEDVLRIHLEGLNEEVLLKCMNKVVEKVLEECGK